MVKGGRVHDIGSRSEFFSFWGIGSSSTSYPYASLIHYHIMAIVHRCDDLVHIRLLCNLKTKKINSIFKWLKTYLCYLFIILKNFIKLVSDLTFIFKKKKVNNKLDQTIPKYLVWCHPYINGQFLSTYFSLIFFLVASISLIKKLGCSLAWLNWIYGKIKSKSIKFKWLH